MKLETMKKHIKKIIRRHLVVQEESPEAYQLSNYDEDNLVSEIVGFVYLKIINSITPIKEK